MRRWSESAPFRAKNDYGEIVEYGVGDRPEGAVLLPNRHFLLGQSVLWDPATGMQQRLMIRWPNGWGREPRYESAHVGLPDGSVLILGGVVDSIVPVRWAERLDLVNEKAIARAPLLAARQQPQAFWFPDGTLGLFGGRSDRTVVPDPGMELHDVSSDTWTRVEMDRYAFFGSTNEGSPLATKAVQLPDGDLIATPTSDGRCGTTWRYSWRDRAWKQVASLPVRYHPFGLVTMADGRVLALQGHKLNQCGIGGDGARFQDDTYIYDPATDSWSRHARMNVPRAAASLASLPCGVVIAVGGFEFDGPSHRELIELYDPKRDKWFVLPKTPQLHQEEPVLRMLPDGALMILSGRLDAVPMIPYPAPRALFLH